MVEPFSYRQAQETAAAFEKHGARYLFLGKSGAIILGFPDTTQDTDLFVEKSPANGKAVIAALRELGFPISAEREAEIARGKDFVQIREGPFDLDLIFAPHGIESFAAAYQRSVVVAGMRVCDLGDIIASKEKAGRIKDRESLPRLRAFRDWWLKRRNEARS